LYNDCIDEVKDFTTLLARGCAGQLEKNMIAVEVMAWI